MLCDLNMTYASFPPPHLHHIHRICHAYRSTTSTASAMSIPTSPHPPYPPCPHIHCIHHVPSQSAKQLAYRGRLHSIHTCPPRPSSPYHGTPVWYIACTGYHPNLQGERK